MRTSIICVLLPSRTACGSDPIKNAINASTNRNSQVFHVKVWFLIKPSTCSHTFAAAKCRAGSWQEINVNLMVSYRRLIIRAQDVLAA